MHSATIPTPAGPFTIIADDDYVYASGWTDDIDELVDAIAPALRPTFVTAVDDLGRFTDAARRYHEGELEAIDDIPVRQESGPFIEEAWHVLRTVKAGEPVTYAEFATACGRPSAARAAASACARNAAALFVPCHRVVRTGGGMGGFRWGTDVKRWLLAHESPHGQRSIDQALPDERW